jgi:hypothetical protein
VYAVHTTRVDGPRGVLSAGLATAQAEPILAGRRAIEVIRVLEAKYEPKAEPAK